ncbi:formylglycine-generating enzyme family protein [Candidatus Poribacteria bacterium]|nr:formylglycine-generating enzyme family protein [Candidatus Poribacteria bacterium]MYG09057.1 formylglycine-generating enzyme family protein [Candidatus Poribacteria bacterium]MYK24577.1 formylglycine-generating enzyme family protein [Candidatus Poribacteria bacterium]
MKTIFRLFGLALICFLTVYIVGCGQGEEDEEVSPTELVRADPSTDDSSPIAEPLPELAPEPAPEPIIPDGMVLIIEGEFQMGSNGGNADNDEQPVHTVHLDAFYIDANEVTNGEFKDFVLANPAWQKEQIDEKFHDDNYLQNWNGNNFPLGERDHPVRYVSWYAAMAYAVWVDKRLPTEAEWEKAARGGLEKKQYPWGT